MLSIGLGKKIGPFHERLMSRSFEVEKVILRGVFDCLLYLL